MNLMNDTSSLMNVLYLHACKKNSVAIWKFTGVAEHDGFLGYELESFVTPGAYLNIRGQGDVRSVVFEVSNLIMVHGFD